MQQQQAKAGYGEVIRLQARGRQWFEFGVQGRNREFFFYSCRAAINPDLVLRSDCGIQIPDSAAVRA
jgi:hypothetical protein